jgi:hypothetical protein
MYVFDALWLLCVLLGCLGLVASGAVAAARRLAILASNQGQTEDNTGREGREREGCCLCGAVRRRMASGLTYGVCPSVPDSPRSQRAEPLRRPLLASEQSAQ